MENKGLSKDEIEKLEKKLKVNGSKYLAVDVENNSDEYFHFQFIGAYEGKPVVFDAVMYTLRLHHSSEVFELAEKKAARHFPNFKRIAYREDENGNLAPLNDLEEEIGLYMAEVIAELEEEGQIKVKEHVAFDDDSDYGIGLDIGLNVEKINSAIINRFIKEFTSDTLTLDPTLYAFQTATEED